jgi:hypothetical protein
MISRLEVANFYCLREPQVIDLRVAANVRDEPGRFAPVWRGAQERAVKVIALFGANAAGKSTVLHALAFLSWFVRNSFYLPPDSAQPCERFNDEAARDQPTRLAIRFAGPADPSEPPDSATPLCAYSYEVVFGGKGKPQHVEHEALRYWPIATGRQVRLFERKQDGSMAAGKAFELAGYRSAIEKILRPNASVISTLAQLGHPLSLLLRLMAGTIISNVFIEQLEINDDNGVRYYVENPNLLRALNHEIERIDLGVREMQIQAGANGPIALFQHQGLTTPLPVHLESHGTRMFVRMYPLLHEALRTGGIAVIDDLDLAIHPIVLPEIIRWFYDAERNPYHAQLWMTCQNVSLLAELAKEEIFFCEKDPKGRTTIYGLQDIQAVRRGDNYYRKYLGGVYGAVPHLG